MKDFYNFVSENPLICLLTLLIICETISDILKKGKP